jgi:hypothetical protein
MAAPELTHFDTSVLCHCLINECSKTIEKRAFFNADVRGLQKARGNERGGLNQNNFGT